MIEMTVYRHKEYKNMFLARDPQSPVAKQGYFATRSPERSAASVAKWGTDFLSWLRNDPDLSVDFTFSRAIETHDGFYGTVEKLVQLRVADFEPVRLVEVE